MRTKIGAETTVDATARRSGPLLRRVRVSVLAAFLAALFVPLVAPAFLAAPASAQSPTIIVNPTSLDLKVGGQSASYTVKLSTQPADDVMVTFGSSDDDQVLASSSTLTFTNSDWSAPKTTLVVSHSNATVGSTATVTATAASRDRDYNGVTASVTVRLIAADTPTPTNTPSDTPTTSVMTDRAALVALYQATNGANWKNNVNWLTDKPIGTWHGVRTDASGRVTHLNLNNNELSGSIPSELGNLTNLKFLYLAPNQLSGCVPAVWRTRPVRYNDLADLGLPFC